MPYVTMIKQKMENSNPHTRTNYGTLICKVLLQISWANYVYCRKTKVNLWLPWLAMFFCLFVLLVKPWVIFITVCLLYIPLSETNINL